MWVGKIFGVIIGANFGGFLGALIGFLAGHWFDKGRIGINRDFGADHRARVEEAFYHTVFPLLGCIAKADGRISEEEVANTEQFMAQMRLSADKKKRAIELFKQGAAPDFSVQATLSAYMAICGQHADLKQILLVYLITLALADGSLHAEEERILSEIARYLGYSDAVFQHFLRMATAQEHFHGKQQGGGQSEARELQWAYEALGVDRQSSATQIKKAYRKLMSEYHPDKLIGRGVPDDVVQMATEKSQEIQRAYDLIKKSQQTLH